MGLRLPRSDSALRTQIDIHQLAELGASRSWDQLPTFAQARRQAVIAMHNDPAIRSINSLTLRADDTLELIQVGPKGGVKTLWRFGSIH